MRLVCKTIAIENYWANLDKIVSKHIDDEVAYPEILEIIRLEVLQLQKLREEKIPKKERREIPHVPFVIHHEKKQIFIDISKLNRIEDGDGVTSLVQHEDRIINLYNPYLSHISLWGNGRSAERTDSMLMIALNLERTLWALCEKYGVTSAQFKTLLRVLDELFVNAQKAKMERVLASNPKRFMYYLEDMKDDDGKLRQSTIKEFVSSIAVRAHFIEKFEWLDDITAVDESVKQSAEWKGTRIQFRQQDNSLKILIISNPMTQAELELAKEKQKMAYDFIAKGKTRIELLMKLYNPTTATEKSDLPKSFGTGHGIGHAIYDLNDAYGDTGKLHINSTNKNAYTEITLKLPRVYENEKSSNVSYIRFPN